MFDFLILISLSLTCNNLHLYCSVNKWAMIYHAWKIGQKTRDLRLNIEETMFMPFSSCMSRLSYFSEIYVHVNENVLKITQTDTVKYLGIHIDTHMIWNIHAEHVVWRRLMHIMVPVDFFLDYRQHIAWDNHNIQDYRIKGYRVAYVKNFNVAQKRILKSMLQKCA